MLIWLATAQAATVVVDPGGGGDATTVMGGVALAATGDTVEVAPGTYVEDVDFQARTIALTSRDGSTTTFLVGTGAGPVVRIDSGEGAGTSVAGFTIQGGDASAFSATDNSGGGLHSRGVPLTLDDLVFVDNVAEYGGGALVGDAENIDVRGCVFSGNRARFGGGLYVLTGSATIQDTRFDGNTADLDGASGGGGGLVVYQATATTRDTSFIGNGAVSSGGAVYAGTASTFTCTFCEVTEGSADEGGGVYANGANILLTATTVTDNVGTSGGGGLLGANASVLQLYAVLLDANDAAYGGAALLSDSNAEGVFTDATRNTAQGGGGWYVQQSDLDLANSMLAGNVASTANGGGVALDQGTTTLDAVVFSNNQGYSGGGLHVNGTSIATLTNITFVEGSSSGSAGGVRVSDGGVLTLVNSIVAYTTAGSGISAGAGAIVSLRYNDLTTNANGNTSGGLADPTGTNGNLSENPLFVAFAQDGAWTDDLHLTSGSPCVDAGDPTILDADGSRSDIGAYGGPNGAAWDDLDGDVDGYTPGEGDCDDADPDVHPGAFDGCDDIDQDCDGTAREGCDTGTVPTDDTGTDPNTDDSGTTTPTGDDSGTPADDTGAKPGGGGCGCATSTPSPGGWLLGLLALAAARRRLQQHQ